MNYFSSDYIYIIKASFETNWWQSLLYCLPTMFFGLVALLEIAGIVWLVWSIKKAPSGSGYQFVKGYCVLVITLLSTLPFPIYLSYISIPEMGMIKFNNEESTKIANIIYTEKIEEHQENIALAPFVLSSPKYDELERELYAKFPNASYAVIHHKTVSKPLNRLFLQCFMKHSQIKVNGITINQIKDIIKKNEEECLIVAANRIIKQLKTMEVSK